MRRSNLDANLRALWADDAAPTSVEYAIMLSGITVVIAASVLAFGQGVAGLFDELVSRWP
jgi:Flp pilus assembly pilin Flp